ncbi:hypothetical protein [Erwinia sp. PsM31]|uniref:hypothetical protein n=1 Tax=Erwinia sp. PsM31 TaxID=3030535 RepID=UPI00263AE91F|nr:hypothetical protein [Erwinia sp. PsM31]MDN4628651.1 hypothetical protein [Erwinia sp. PsM31]
MITPLSRGRGMLPDKEVITAITVYGSCITDQLTHQGITAAVTSTQISNLVFLGVTLGGWVTIILAIGAVLLFVMNLVKFIQFSYGWYKKIRQYFNKK